MKAGQGIARFMELRGRRVEEAAGALWHGVEGRFYMSIPYQLVFEPEAGDLERMLRSVRGAGARYPSTRRPGSPSGLYVCRNRAYDIRAVDTRQRSRVRRGLERCEIRPLDGDELISQGLRLNRDTMERQGRYDAEFGEPASWQRLVRAVVEAPAVSCVGAFVDGRLAAYMITCREDGWSHILHQMSRADLLEHHPNHALTFRVTQQEMNNPETEAVCYGSVSLVPIEGLHEYKLRLGYDLAPHASVLFPHPSLSGVLGNGLLLRAVQALQRLRPQDQRVARVTAVLAGARLHRAAGSETEAASFCGAALPTVAGASARKEA